MSNDGQRTFGYDHEGRGRPIRRTMATPVGHGLVGIALARRLGVRSPAGLLAAGMAASLPDADMIVGFLLHGDPYKMHRKGMHTLNFAVTAGALAGMTGALSAGNIEGERDLVADALMGALIVGSHIPLDRAPIPEIRLGPKLLGLPLGNWLLDAALWGSLAWAIWPRNNAQRV